MKNVLVPDIIQVKLTLNLCVPGRARSCAQLQLDFRIPDPKVARGSLELKGVRHAR
jgi:hypothetical protein